MAAHERKRKVSKLKDAPVRGRNMQGRKTKEPAIDPAKRVDQFPDESLEVTPGDKLFCRACKTERSIRLSSLNAHLASDAHKAKLKVHFEALDGDEDLTALVTHFFENHPELGTSPEGAAKRDACVPLACDGEYDVRRHPVRKDRHASPPARA